MYISSFQMNLVLIAEITALLHYGKTQPDYTGLDQDAKKSLKKLIEQLEPKLKELENKAEGWLEKRRSEILNTLENLPKNARVKIKREKDHLEQLSELEQLPTTNLSERVARVREINDNRLGGDTAFSKLQIDEREKKDCAPTSRQTIEDTMIRLPRVYRPRRGFMKSLSESEFLIAGAIYAGQLCGILYLWPVSATHMGDFVSIFWVLEDAANAAKEEAAKEDDEAQNMSSTPRGRKRRFKNDSKLDGEDPTTDTELVLKPFEKTAQPFTPSPKRLRQEMPSSSPSSQQTVSTVVTDRRQECNSRSSKCL